MNKKSPRRFHGLAVFSFKNAAPFQLRIFGNSLDDLYCTAQSVKDLFPDCFMVSVYPFSY